MEVTKHKVAEAAYGGERQVQYVNHFVQVVMHYSCCPQSENCQDQTPPHNIVKGGVAMLQLVQNTSCLSKTVQGCGFKMTQLQVAA